MRLFKLFRIICLLIVVSTVNLYADKNLGFMQNQKYVCIGTHAVVGEDVIQIQSKEDSLKYPTRFYIDDDMVLHTDGKVDNIFKYDGEEAWKSKDSIIVPKIEDGQRVMFRLLLSGPIKGAALLFKCTETDNWTLVR